MMSSRLFSISLMVVVCLQVGFLAVLADDGSEVLVVELGITASDELPWTTVQQGASALAQEVRIENGRLVIGPRAARAIRWKRLDSTLQLAGDIRKVEDIKAVLIQRVVYQGKGRSGAFRRVILGQGLVPFPQDEVPKSVTLGVWDNPQQLQEILPLPQQVSWRLVRGSKPGEQGLEISTPTKTMRLSPGEEFVLEPVTIKVSIEIEGFAAVPKADLKQAKEAKTIWEKLREIEFGSKAKVRYHGHLPLIKEAL